MGCVPLSDSLGDFSFCVFRIRTVFADMDQLSGWRVADKLEKRSLLIAVNCVAALSIFFFGYDQ
jgi:hypothetical protein